MTLNWYKKLNYRFKTSNSVCLVSLAKSHISGSEEHTESEKGVKAEQANQLTCPPQSGINKQSVTRLVAQRKWWEL